MRPFANTSGSCLAAFSPCLAATWLMPYGRGNQSPRKGYKPSVLRMGRQVIFGESQQQRQAAGTQCEQALYRLYSGVMRAVEVSEPILCQHFNRVFHGARLPGSHIRHNRFPVVQQ